MVTEKELLQQNSRRWNLVKVITICTVFVLSGFLYGVFRQFKQLKDDIEKVMVLSSDRVSPSSVVRVKKKLSEREKLILYGDKTFPTYLLQQKAIHDKFPKNKTYLANYINNITFECVLSKDKYIKFSAEKKQQIADKNSKLLEILTSAEKADPNNSLYNYYKCYVYLTEAIVGKAPGAQSKSNLEAFVDPKLQQFEVINKHKFDLAINEYYQGITKPYFKSYSLDLTIERIKLADNKIDSFAIQLDRAFMHMGTRFPHYIYLRSMVEALKFRAEYEYKNNNIVAVEKLFNSSLTFIEQTVDDCDTYNVLLNNIGLQRILFKSACEFYKQIDDKKQLDFFKKKYLLQKELVGKIYKNEYPKELEFRKSCGFFAGMIIPRVNPTDSEMVLFKQLRPERMMSYKLGEIVVVSVYGGSILLIVIGLWILTVKWRNLLEVECVRKRMPLFLKLTTADYLRMVAIAMVIPLVLYLLITNVDAISGRFYLSGNLSVALYQMMFLFISITLPTFVALNIIMKKHYQKFDLENKKIFNINIVQGLIIYSLVLLGSTVLLPNMWLGNLTSYTLLVTLVRLFVILLSLISLILMLYFFVLLIKKTNFVYRLVIVNSLPYFAVISVVMMMMFFAIFKEQINYYFMQDKYILVKDPKVQRTFVDYNAMKMGKSFILNKILNNKK